LESGEIAGIAVTFTVVAVVILVVVLVFLVSLIFLNINNEKIF